MTRHAIAIGSLIVSMSLAISSPALAQSDTATASGKTNPPAAATPADKPADQPAAKPADQNDTLPAPKFNAPKVFITGAYGAGTDRSSHFVTNQPGLQTNLSGHLSNRTFGIGTFVTPHWSVRFEMGLPATLHVASTSSGTATVQSLSVAQTTRTASVLFGYHTASTRRVSMEYLGGVAFIAQRQNAVSQVFDPSGFPLSGPMETDSYSYKSTAVAGADVNITVVRHFAIVPEFRAWVLGGTLSLRAALGFRVNF
jgi:hypothetical protein